ncbi:hypothetical protein CSKR_200330 [Clonorchis sinensis]|uniref:Uncharacterized protein n=1 Tax=Clonorchis sinensis TaxID=79923 RepID=A0A8T1MBY7_CLOSI|nr:hypothetical protein CSKR_200330 [Clonorchis sinensis]
MFRKPGEFSSISASKFLESENPIIADFESFMGNNESQFPGRNIKRTVSPDKRIQSEELKSMDGETTLLEQLSSITESLMCLLSQIQESRKQEENFVSEIHDLCSKAKALESKLLSKKSLILSHFQQLVTNLDREN